MRYVIITLIIITFTNCTRETVSEKPVWLTQQVAELEKQLVDTNGEEQRSRIHRGLDQTSRFWRTEDGDAAVFSDFATTHFSADPIILDAILLRYQSHLEQLSGHMNKMSLQLKQQTDLDIGPVYPFDRIFAGYEPAAHITDDFFANKLAFIVLLNFPLTTLTERLERGGDWTRKEWAEARLAQHFESRVPSAVNQKIGTAISEAGQYVADYNIWMHHLVDSSGNRLFPAGMKLLSHWNLRDEIKAQYGNGDDGLKRQRMIMTVMEHIIYQSIPRVVVNNPFVDWNPRTNTVTPTTEFDSDQAKPENQVYPSDREPDTRYQQILNVFHAYREEDAYYPTAPTYIQRRFEIGREFTEDRVQDMFKNLLHSPALEKTVRLIEQRLGRTLEPFDIWYNGFRGNMNYDERQLDTIVKHKFPDREHFKKCLCGILIALDFAPDKARLLADEVEIDPARGSGHAWGPAMRSEKAHLRTRIGKNGMDYKGYNIALHELGHNIEQLISLKQVDYTLLEGVPNNAFTEAFAFVFQNQDLRVLGLVSENPQSDALEVLDQFWGACEISAVALVDMKVWHWLYAHPNADARELRTATVMIARDVWNEFFAPLFGISDVPLLAIYSHMLHYPLYLPDYPIGHFIAFQVEQQIRKTGKIGPEFERMAMIGNISPDLWMKEAVGTKVGPEALIAAAEAALKKIGE